MRHVKKFLRDKYHCCFVSKTGREKKVKPTLFLWALNWMRCEELGSYTYMLMIKRGNNVEGVYLHSDMTGTQINFLGNVPCLKSLCSWGALRKSGKVAWFATCHNWIIMSNDAIGPLVLRTSSLNDFWFTVFLIKRTIFITPEFSVGNLKISMSLFRHVKHVGCI